ncbi:hypothetical protein Mkiyose1088_36030 [Mycobacterium kiyosense]|uniref:hypothetical protein n=1 Tax=Mycobacterium TaxID=1763 RepID=UPI001EE2A2BB|nr:MULTISPECIES: hypothetical protein [Mycobacterium]BDE17058.1 hypothetical protein MKCMC460_59180 [Mycobacterium sp. 20KCMC460]GLC22610.1 hypothetical protein SRL2020472_51810 [Mycobacterium kiyosense]GLD01737.1 hypothetical protein Mkiyose1088_36030 [Mycobacterium kiyosense]GLD08317.1 hypothetical protein Mkiyose1383_46430 [Mycobacterium kiyosense]GLD14467.1 hypothetical protein Mkiyose1384_46930 [Mycobacterium kiyosense]
MDHEFELAFNLIDEAAGRIQHQQYGITRILFHNHGDIALTTVHDYTRDSGHRLVLFATDAHGQLAAVEATAPDLNTEPHTRILKVRAGDLTFHAVPGHDWAYRAAHTGHTFTLIAGIADEPMWTVTLDNNPPVVHEDLDTALDHIAAGALLAA